MQLHGFLCRAQQRQGAAGGRPLRQCCCHSLCGCQVVPLCWCMHVSEDCILPRHKAAANKADPKGLGHFGFVMLCLWPSAGLGTDTEGSAHLLPVETELFLTWKSLQHWKLWGSWGSCRERLTFLPPRVLKDQSSASVNPCPLLLPHFCFCGHLQVLPQKPPCSLWIL